MALLNTTDETITRTALARWFAQKMPQARGVELTGISVPQAGGMSMTTILFQVSWTEAGEARMLDLVARVQPAAGGLFADSDLGREFRLLSALTAHSDVAVPAPHWFEQDPTVLGAPFVVVARAFGRVPCDDPPYTVAGWVLELPTDERGKLYENSLRAMASIHAVDWRAAGLEFLDRPQLGRMGIEQQLGAIEAQYEWARQEIISPTIEAGLRWARDNAPADEELVLNWGDPRIANIVFGDDLSVAAVLDWEMATIASPQMDLGWFAFIVRYFSDGIGVEIPEGMQTRAELISRYTEVTGRQTEHIDYYEALAALRLSTLILRAGHLMIDAGAIPPDDPMPVSNPASQLLARLLDLPAPIGEMANFIGKR